MVFSTIRNRLKPNVLFDRLEQVLEGTVARRTFGRLLVFVFVSALIVVELKRQQVFPSQVNKYIPGDSYFLAIELTFGLLLIIEGISLIFGLGRSVSDAVGKQIEIFSLILLRKSFKEFSNFGTTLEWADIGIDSVGHMLSDAVGALVIFLLLGLYYRIQKHQQIAPGEQAQADFIKQKKAIALLLFVAYISVGLTDMWLWLIERQDRLIPFFEVFYTLLIFVDILLVLVSLQFSSSYKVAFRNSGFAVATVLLRVALVAPAYFNALLGVVSTVYALGLTLAYNFFLKAKDSPVINQHGYSHSPKAEELVNRN